MQAAKGYQFSHLVRASDVLHPGMWAPAPAAGGGMWAPSHWMRSAFVIDDATAAGVMGILRVRPGVCVCTRLQGYNTSLCHAELSTDGMQS